MIARGGVDDGIASARFGSQQIRIIERADDRFDAACRYEISLFLAANEAANLVTISDQGRRNRTANIAARAGKEDFQIWLSSVSLGPIIRWAMANREVFARERRVKPGAARRSRKGWISPRRSRAKSRRCARRAAATDARPPSARR